MPRPKIDKYADGRVVFETLLEAYGEDEMLQYINYRIMDKMTLVEVCDELMVPYPVLWEWMSDEMSRLQSYEKALKGLSDQIVHGFIKLAQDSGDAKIQFEAGKWLASRWDRSRFGENVKVEVNHSVGLISLLSSLKDIEGEVLEDKTGLLDNKIPETIVEVVPEGTGSEVPKENS